MDIPAFRRAVGLGLAIGLEMSTLAAGLSWEERTSHRYATLGVPTGTKEGLTLLSGEATGIRWTNSLTYERAVTNQNLLNGAGVAAGDFDGDGWCDLYFCNRQGSNALFRNLGGWRFDEVTELAGVACLNQASGGAVFADLDGDGDLDLFVTALGGPNALFLNSGNARFTNVTALAGLLSKAGGMSAALADVDGNGTLDLYVANYGETSILRSGGRLHYRVVNGQVVISGRDSKRVKVIDNKVYEVGEPDGYYLNKGQARFEPVAWTGGAFLDEKGDPLTAELWDMGLSVMFRDINGDGAPDLYVCNDFQTPDRIWINDGKGRFRAIAPLALRSQSHFSMGVDFADVDRDGRDDFFVADMLSRLHSLRTTQIRERSPDPWLTGQSIDRPQIHRNTLLWNRGDGTYAEIAFFSGLAASDWTWSSVFVDVDLDGFEDLLLANNHLYDTQDLDAIAKSKSAGRQTWMESMKNLAAFPPLRNPNLAFRNRGSLRFDEVGESWGFNSRQVSHGIALADLDNDGDQDVVVSCLNDPPLLYRNDSTAPRVAVRLRGTAPNTRGIGAKIEVMGGAVPSQSQEMICGGRYLSSDDPMRVFAAGSLTNEMRIEVRWRSGRRSVVNGVKANRIYEIDESAAESTNPQPSTLNPAKPLFEDVSALLGHTHHEKDWDDFAAQPLLPRKLSQLGPGVAWFDLDGDAHEDLVIGAGKGGSPAVYLNDGKGSLKVVPKAWTRTLDDDATGIVGVIMPDGRRTLFVGIANYESGATNSPSAAGFDLSPATAANGVDLPASPTSTGPLALADVDGDGDLDLFVGGRVVRGRYPESGDSRLFLSQGGRFVLDAENRRALERVGLVSGAVFADLNSDAWPDLVLACEWGPVRVFENQKGRLRERTEEMGLAKLLGLWSGITTGDFDGDGRVDIVAGNWGLNSFYQLSPKGPWHLYFGDFHDDGRMHLLEGHFEPQLQKIVPWRDMNLVAGSLPWVKEHFRLHKEYAQAAVAEILEEKAPRTREVLVNTLASTVFLNRGERFEPVSLPAAAQWSSAMGLNVADMDGDGREDLFISQNFFAVHPEDARLDAGRGLWLRGDGKGGLTAVSGQESGIKVYGEQRGAALCDYDGDGRVDVVVTQNGGQTKLYRNAAAKPGLRVRLKGPPGNPEGIGAQIRLNYGQRQGPTRELHAGSGYWSQDSAVQVFGVPEPPTQILVRWPGGQTTTSQIPSSAREIEVNSVGEARMMR